MPIEPKIQQKRKVLFKPYDQGLKLSIPVAVEELIPAGHLSRIIDEVVEQLALAQLEEYYRGGGTSSYHPRMLIKVWLYGYCEGVYTSRRLAKALREHIPFIWLAGGARPCFKTLSAFRGARMKGMIDVVFKQVLALLVEEGYINLEDVYVDGSKWEANANRHKVVWAKNTERHKANVLHRIEALLERIDALQAAEDEQYGRRDLAELGQDKQIKVVLSSARVSEYLLELNQALESKAQEHKEAKALAKLAKDLDKEREKLEKYEGQERVLAGRNSYSKTDEDATAFRMKDDRLLPAYNMQHTTSAQFIVNYTAEQCAAHSTTLPAHLDKLEERQAGLAVPEQQNVSADAAYGSEENYADLERRKMKAHVKYSGFYLEQSGQLQKMPFRRENFAYDAEQDKFTCPQGRSLVFINEQVVKTDNGYAKTLRLYQCENCQDCPFAAECKKNQDQARTVSFSPKGEAYKAQARELLNSDKGRQMCSQRGVEVESAFGDIKYNMHHRRFLLRGKDKVYIEYGLLALGHNLRKLYCAKSGCWAAYYAQRARKRA